MSSQTTTLNRPLSVVEHPVFLASAAFTIPLIAHQPQLLVGTLVNALLFAFARTKLELKQLIPLACLPSIAALLHGVVLNQLTPLLRFTLPLIWVGNVTEIMMARQLTGRSYMVPAAAIAKTIIIFAGTWALFQLHVVPRSLLLPMGSIQAMTALVGGIVSVGTHRLIER